MLSVGEDPVSHDPCRGIFFSLVCFPRPGPVMAAHVLIVDDDSDTRSILESFLSHHGFTVETAPTAVDATERLRTTKPAAVILDLHLPGTSGFALMEAWQTNGEAEDIPIICFTGLAETGARSRAEALGCAAFVPKPAEPRRLLHLLKKLCPAG